MTIEAKLERIIELLEGALKAPAVPTEEPPAPQKKPRAPKTEASAPTAAVAAPAEAPSAVPAASDKPLTLDDVRNALVKAQTRFGSKEKPAAVLAKYSKTGTTGGLAVADYSKVISECETLK